nr:hypothetical protein [Halomonas sp. 1513]
MICPHWKTVLSALLVPLVAIFGSYIAYRQWRTAQNKLKLDLFDRRVAIYEAARHLIVSARGSGRVSQVAEFKYQSGIRGARWLYNEEIVKYLEEDIWHKVVDLGTLESELDNLPVGEERTRIIREQREIKDWLADQLRVLEQKVAPFLVLRH